MLYDVESPAKKALDGLSMASGSFARMGQDIPANRDPGTTTGGAVSAGMGGAALGATVGSAMATGAATGSAVGPWGAAAGAAVGIAAYLLS